MSRRSRAPMRLVRAAGLLPAPIQRSLLLGSTLGWFALELILARMVHPARTVRCFQILWLFLRAQRSAQHTLHPLLVGDGEHKTRLISYARNCIVLVALQPERSGATIDNSSDWIQPTTLFGAAIPLYDGCFDHLPTRRARALGLAVGEALTTADANDGDLEPLIQALSDHGAVAANAANWQVLVRGLDTWLRQQPPHRRQRLLAWMIRMNDAQIASLGERTITLSQNDRRHLSALKGGVSFLLLRLLGLPDGPEATGATDQARAALLQTAAVAQWIDDYADVREDLQLGIETYIGRLEGGQGATRTIRAGIRESASALRAVYGRRAERLIDSLALYFAFKRSLRMQARLAQALRPGPGPGVARAAPARGQHRGWP